MASSIDWMIEQQKTSGRPMDCSFIVLAEQYKAIHDATPNPQMKIKVENDFRKALMLLPAFEPVHSRMIISYVFNNPDSYTPAQKALILKDHIEYLIAKITPETKGVTMAFLQNLLESKKRPNRLDKHPALEALIRKTINNTPV